MHPMNPSRRHRFLRKASGLAAIAFVLTACGGAADSPSDAEPPPPRAGGGGSEVELTARDLSFEPSEVTAAAGSVVVVLTNEGALQHDVIIEEAGDTLVVEASGGSTERGTIDLEPGTYTFYCGIAGHRQAGMEGTLTIEG